MSLHYLVKFRTISVTSLLQQYYNTNEEVKASNRNCKHCEVNGSAVLFFTTFFFVLFYSGSLYCFDQSLYCFPNSHEAPMINVIEKWRVLHFTRWCGDIFQVRWVNLYFATVKFPQESVYQKLLKSVYFWPSYSKNIKGTFSEGQSVEMNQESQLWQRNRAVTEISRSRQ